MSRTVSFFLFFFSSSGAPRLFPSFPTRRSSDLGGPCAPDWVTVGGADCGGGDSGGPVFAGETAFGIMKGGTWDRAGKCRLDRKSTRLNSSHRCISYAVFCLKKKKKQHNRILQER